MPLGSLWKGTEQTPHPLDFLMVLQGFLPNTQTLFYFLSPLLPLTTLTHPPFND